MSLLWPFGGKKKPSKYTPPGVAHPPPVLSDQEMESEAKRRAMGGSPQGPMGNTGTGGPPTVAPGEPPPGTGMPSNTGTAPPPPAPPPDPSAPPAAPQAHGGSTSAPSNPVETINGKPYVRDGSWWVDKAIVDAHPGILAMQKGQNPALDALVEGNRMEYSQGLNAIAAAKQGAATAAKTTSSGYDSEGERQIRQQRANAIGVNWKSDENQDDPIFVAKQQLAEELLYGHYVPMPGQPGVYFNYHGPGNVEFKNSNGQRVQGDPAAAEQAQTAESARINGGAPAAAPAPATPPPAAPASPEGGKTKQVNGVWYTRQSDGTWLKSQDPALGTTAPAPAAAPTVTPPVTPTAPGAQLSKMLGAQTASLSALKIPNPAMKPMPAMPGMEIKPIAPMKAPSLAQPTLSGGFGTLGKPSNSMKIPSF